MPEAPEDPQEPLISVPIRRKVTAPIPSAIRRGGESTPSRAWSPLGTLDGGEFAQLDRNGLLHMAGRDWSLDWWVGAEDRWHFASMEASMRQSAMSSTPVIESLMRVPGGDIVQRVGAVALSGTAGITPAVKIEIENSSAVPVALALVIRPWRLDAEGSVRAVDLSGGVAEVNGGDAAVTFSRPVARVVHGTRDSVAPALSDGVDEAPGESYTSRNGDLEVALIFPLAHTATLDLVVTAPEESQSRIPRERIAGTVRRLMGRTSPDLPRPTVDPQTHQLSRVVSGWQSHGENDPWISAPIRDWAELLTWSGSVLRLGGTSEVTRALGDSDPLAGTPSADRVDAVARELSSLDPSASDSIAAALVGVQRMSGEVRLPDGSDAAAGLLHAAAGVFRAPWAHTRQDDYVGAVAKAVSHLDKTRPAPTFDEARSLTAVAAGLVRLGQPEVAQRALEVASRDQQPVRSNAQAVQTGAQVEDKPISEFIEARLSDELIRAGDEEGLLRLARRIASRGGAGVSELTDGGGRPVGELGIDMAELAATRSALMNMVVLEGIGGPVILPTFPATWIDKPVEARQIPTGWGEVSVALRWHDGIPVILWEVTPWFGAAGSGSAPVLRCGLDPAWIGVGWEGEAYLDHFRTGEPSES